jgi:uncharacterized protein (TIGR00725 family)
MIKIAVCGSGTVESALVAQKAKEIGAELAKSNIILLTGGCAGYPYAAARGAILEHGKVTCYSPARSKEEHISEYGFPFDSNAEYIYTGKGIPGRNIPLVKNADAIIIVGGKIGTLNEFTIAFNEKKKIAVLQDSGSMVQLLPKIALACDKSGESRNIIYRSTPKELVTAFAFSR